MGKREYVALKEDGWSGPTNLPVHMAFVGKKLVMGHGPFTILQDGDPIGFRRNRWETLVRYRKAVSSRELGSTFRIRKGNGDIVFTGRPVKAEPDTIDTNGNKKADEYWTWIVSNYREYHPRFAGAYVCKTISGSGNMSQHSYGNAVDVFFDSLAHQEKVFDDIRAGKCPVSVCHAISARSIWEPGTGTHYYSGDYHSHLHSDFCPQCSGGCGSRNC